MKSNEKYKFYEKMYFEEKHRKETQNSKLTVIITIFSIATALINYNIAEYFNLTEVSKPEKIIFLHIIILCILCYIVALYFTLRAFVGYKYLYLPSANSIHHEYEKNESYFRAYYEENRKYFESKNITIDELRDESMMETLSNLYIESSTHNFLQNNIKTKYLRFCLWSLGVLVVLCLICSLITKFI